MSTFFLGQGSQYVGMGKDLYNLYPRSAKLVFDEADEALKYGLSALIFEGKQVRTKNNIMCVIVYPITF